MKIIGTTKDGFIAELSQTEAAKLCGQTPQIGTEANPLNVINKARWINEQSERLTQLEASLKTATANLSSLISRKEVTRE